VADEPKPACPWSEELLQLSKSGLLRTMPVINGIPGPKVTVNGREVLNFSSNNYLGMAGHPAVVEAQGMTAARCGAGASASRLISGNSEAHRELEAFIADWKGTEAALVFGSGYQANVGVLSALAGREDLIVSDELNHASIIDGCRLSRAKVAVYPHLDLNRVEDLLKDDGYRRKILVTETVFSMDGDCAAMKELADICSRWGAVLMVDEAHATGVLGPRGQGLAADRGLVPEIQMGTLGKAVGVCGAYVAGSRALIDLLINRARSLIYTTASAPAIQGGALAALKMVASEEGDARRARLKENVRIFADLLKSEGIASASGTHIVPVRIGESFAAMRVSAECLERGVFAHGIRYPTVPEGTARLRFTLNSELTEQDLKTAVNALKEAIAICSIP